MRVAYFSPLNPQRTGVSDYSEELLPFLANHVDLDLFVDGFAPSNPEIRDRFACFDCVEFDERHRKRPYDLNLYQMGNSLHHAAICQMLFRHPGIVVLHEVWLHHMFVEMARRDQDPSIYLRELAYSAGSSGLALGHTTLNGEREFPLFNYSLIDRVVDASLAVIVHSSYARQQVERIGSTEVAVVPQHIIGAPAMSAAERQRTRRDHSIAANCILLGAFGQATPPKRLDTLVRSFRRLRDVIPEVRLLIVGEVNPPGWLNPLVDSLELGSCVTLTGAVTFLEFQRLMGSTDIGVNLRYPTVGETSATALRFMASGVPVVVSDVGSFSELPLDACLKIPTDMREEGLLFEALRKLSIDDELRSRMGSAGFDHIGASHTPAITAHAYADVLHEMHDSAGTRGQQIEWPVPPAERVESQTNRIRPKRSNMALESEIVRTLAELGISLGAEAITDGTSLQ